MVIMRVSRRQIMDVFGKMHPNNRKSLSDLAISNVYSQIQNILFVADDDVEFAEFPRNKDISLASAASCAFEQTQHYGRETTPETSVSKI